MCPFAAAAVPCREAVAAGGRRLGGQGQDACREATRPGGAAAVGHARRRGDRGVYIHSATFTCGDNKQRRRQTIAGTALGRQR